MNFVNLKLLFVLVLSICFLSFSFSISINEMNENQLNMFNQINEKVTKFNTLLNNNNLNTTNLISQIDSTDKFSTGEFLVSSNSYSSQSNISIDSITFYVSGDFDKLSNEINSIQPIKQQA